ncbi:MAG: FAD-dependent oxidoreductase [Clostridiales bacterium]|nr:FAD-dependent oxidoreductase [Clostridiales bacterium]
MKYIIVGGVAGGASAATRLRRLDETAEIILLEKGDYVSYANCGLPYFIGGTIKDKDRLVVTTAVIFKERFNIDIRTGSEAVRIDREHKTVSIKNHIDGKVYEESYDKLILSPGAAPKRPNLPGIDTQGIFTLRTVPDTYKIDNYIKENNVKSAVVVGAGFVGVEMAENLKERGLSVTIVEFLDQAISSLDSEMAAILHRHLQENGIHLRFKTGVQSFEKAENIRVKLSDDKTLDTDLVILSIGVSPENQLAKDAGLDLSIGGSIKVNSNYQTSDPDIYAVGDAVSVNHLVSGAETLIPLAGPANKQGRLAAENALGRRLINGKGVQGSAILKVFDLIAASTGLNEKQLKAQNIPYLKTYIHPSNHATYYPNSTQISMKLLFAPDGKILGAQAVGYDGVDKRIDVLATVLRLGGTVFDLEELELCYAPPYSSAKDPVNMLGFTAANILRGDMKVFYHDEVEKLDLNSVSLVDVSTRDEVCMGTITGSVNIPVDELRSRMNEIPKEKPVYVFCRVGLRGYIASRILSQNGYDAYNLSGGYKTYNIAKGEKEGASCMDCVGINKNQCSVAPNDNQKNASAVIEVDACGLQCPGPIMKVAEGIRAIKDDETMLVRATDPAFASDVHVWCDRTGNKLIDVSRDKGVYSVLIQKGTNQMTTQSAQSGNDKSMIVFSGDLDKALASLIIANGAAAMGRKVTLFFTFWGLNILRKSEHVNVKKSFIEKMFGMMMPRGSKKLGLSRMNMLGMGPIMIRWVMKNKNVQSLEELLKSAMDNGVRLVACQMSMDIMGIKQEELIDGVEIAGVATFLGSAEQSDTNLFI